MQLVSLTLSGFRSFSVKKSFSFSPTHTIIVGRNSIGKTNLLEALYFVNRGKGFREKHVSELITQTKEGAKVEGVLRGKTHTDTVMVQLKRTGDQAEKHFLVNNLAKPFKEYQGRTKPVVLFQPADLDMVTGPPDGRRQVIDTVIQSADYEYVRAKNNYERGLYKRNKMLQNARFPLDSDTTSILRFWDDFLIKHATYITRARRQFVEFLNEHPYLGERQFRVAYGDNIFSHERVLETAAEEQRIRRTVVGPQLDDYKLFAVHKKEDEQDLALFGSRSEQRLVVLWLKMNELIFFDQTFSEKPLFLVDDIFSELDKENSRRVLAISQKYQTCMTTANDEILSLIKFPVQTIELK